MRSSRRPIRARGRADRGGRASFDAAGIVAAVWLCALALALAACGGSGERRDDQPAGISVDRAYPGQLISVTHPSIRADDVVNVLYRIEAPAPAGLPAGEMQIPVKGIAHADGVVFVTVPPIYDADGSTSSRSTRVVVNGQTLEGTLQIERFLPLDFPTRGHLLMAVMEVAIESYYDAWDDFSEIEEQLNDEVDLSAVLAAIDEQIETLEDQMFEIDHFGRLTIEVEGAPVELSPEDLDRIDLSLLHSWIGLDVATSLTPSSARAFGSPESEPPPDEVLRNAFNAARENFNRLGGPESAGEAFFNDIPNTLNKGVVAGETYVSFVSKFIAAVTTYGGWFGDEALQIAAKARNLSNAQFTFFPSMFTAWRTGKNTDSFLNGDSTEYNQGTEAASQLARLGAEYGSTAGSQTADWVSTGFTIKDGINALRPYCERFGVCSGSQLFYRVRAFRNFNGVIKDERDGVPIEPNEADISLAGPLPGRPDIKWRGGDAVGLFVFDAAFNPLYGIVSRTDPETDDPIPFSSPVHYGSYSSLSYERASSFPTVINSFLKDNFYEIHVQRASDFESATIVFQLTRE